MPNAVSLYQTSLTTANDRTTIKADGKESTLVTFKLTDVVGNVITDASNVDVAFTSTFGNFTEKRVPLQNGLTSALLTSESLSSDKTVLINAKVVDATNRNLIILKAERNILRGPNPDTGQEETVGATLTDISADQADRVTLYFKKDVKVYGFAVACSSEYNAAKATVYVYTNVPNSNTVYTLLALTLFW
ncbi:hypothetical protein MKX62_04080 [Sporosarcina sp. FSL K6-5500]